MSRHNILCSDNEQPFICINCGITVTSPMAGTLHRNHCPYCLWSMHVDLRTGDRLSVCRGKMIPVSICDTSGEWSLIHRCLKCGIIRINRISGDDSIAEMMKILTRLEASAPHNYGVQFNTREDQAL